MPVIHIRHSKKTPDEVLIGRPKKPEAFHFGNPFSHLDHSSALIRVDTREKAIACYELWLIGNIEPDLEPERRAWILKQIPSLRGKTLVCYCKPLPCHGDVLEALSLLDKELRASTPETS